MKINMILASWFATIVVLSKPSAVGHDQPAAKYNIQREFNLLLESTGTSSTIDQFSKLQGFLKDHADFEQAYQTLLEWYLYHDQIQEAKEYFQRLTSSSLYCRNSHWMLAKIFIREDNPRAAFLAFMRALDAGQPSLPLLEDFVKFDHQRSGEFDGKALVHRLDLKHEMQSIVSAFYSYYKSAYEQTIGVFKKTPKQLFHHSVILQMWGDCAYGLSRYAEADSIWRIGFALSRDNGDLHAKAKFLSKLGFLQQIFRKYDFALSYYDSAYTIAKKIKDYYRIQILTGYLAHINRDRGNYSEAEKQFKEAIRIALKLGEYYRLADLFKGYGTTIYPLGRYNEALQAFDKAEEFARKANDAEEVLMVKLDKAGLYVSLKQHTLAKINIQEAINLAQANKLKYYQKLATARLGQILLLEEQYARAREFFAEFINYLNTDENLRKSAYWWMGRLARTYALEKKFERAKTAYIKALQAAKEAGDKAFEGWFLLRIADIELNLGNAEAAIKDYDLARKIALSQKSDEMLWEILLGYGNAYKKMDKLDNAISEYQRAINIIEETRRKLKVDQFRIGYFVEGYQVYQNLIDCFLQRYEQNKNSSDLDSLYYYISLSRGRALWDLKLSKRSLQYSDDYWQTCKQLQRMQRHMREAADRLRPADEIDAFLSKLETTRISLLAQRLRLLEDDTSQTRGQPPSASALPLVLDELAQAGHGLLLYKISEENSFVFVASSKQVGVLRLPVKPSSLAATIDSLMTPFHNLTDDSLQSILFRADIAYRLYGLLIKPVEEAFALPARLLVVPDHALTNLPFEILLAERPERPNYKPSDFPSYADFFLMQRYTFAYCPSPSLLQKRPKPSSKNPSLIAFANPFGSAPRSGQKQRDFNTRASWRFDPLPFSGEEGRRIKAIYSPTRMFSRESATKAVFFKEAPRYQIVHMATHAFVDTTFDAFSGLILATTSDSTDDGMLMGYQIADLDLSCNLVTLSACETGGGKRIVGEGVLGLPRLFLGAGAQSVLMTLWKVDDKFTAKLMPLFYYKLFKEKQSKSEALSEAKRWILDKKIPEGNFYYQHPVYWAAFTLYGDPGMLSIASSLKAEKVFLFIALPLLGLGIIFFIRYGHTHDLRKIIHGIIGARKAKSF